MDGTTEFVRQPQRLCIDPRRGVCVRPCRQSLLTWKTPEDLKKAHPKASILKGGRVVFNIKANDFRLVSLVQYADGVVMIRFFGSHDEYDKIDAESI